MLTLLNDPRMQPLRLASGLILFAFAAAHFFNHAAGLVGLDAANAVQDWRLLVTHSDASRIILPAAAAIHITLGLGKLAARRTMAMPAWEWLQILSGVLVPILLIPHVVAISYYTYRVGFFYSYTSVAYQLWPAHALLQTVLLLVVWTHGCIGINYWLRTKRWYGSVRHWLFAISVAMPLLALTGFLSAAREAHQLLADPAAVAAARAALNWPDSAVVADMLGVRNSSWAIYAGVLLLVASTYGLRQVAIRRAPAVSVSYAGGPTVRGMLGASLLEISRSHGVPHTSVCGGRARCSTCRVRIDAGGAALHAPQSVERATLARIKAAHNVRLACQLRPTADITVTRLVAPSTRALARIGHGSPDADGVEKPVAVLFLDVRGFTRLSQDRLPFDIVFLLNQFFAAVGEVIRNNDGWIDKYMGDGLMAVFGRDSGVVAGSRDALAAAHGIDLALDGLNRRLAEEVAEGLRIGIGIHAGPVVIGRIGDVDSAALTVIGRTVNEASRLEALTKDYGCQLIISRAVAVHANIPAGSSASALVDVRGSDAQLEVLIFKAARDLPEATSASPDAAVSGRKKAALDT